MDPRASRSLGDGPRRVLLLDGFTGTPVEARPIAEALHAANFAVHVPLHVGHRDPDDLAEHGRRNSSPDASEC